MNCFPDSGCGVIVTPNSTTMATNAYSDDSSDDENFHYLLASGIVPFVATTDAGSKKPGSQLGKMGNTAREFDEALHRLNRDYFDESPKYGRSHFERRFRVPPSVFNRIEEALTGSGIFVQKRDALNKDGIHPRLRITAALRMLAYGSAADAHDEYLQMSDDSVLLSLKSFCEGIIQNFGEEYMRAPNEEDLKRIMHINAARGFPGCVGSIDCQHYEWKNCPVAWAGQFKGKEKKPTIVLEAISDGELWIWHYFFGSPGSLNDINVLDHSTTVGAILAGKFPPDVKFVVNFVEYSLPYYLADRIYPNWRLFVKTITEGETPEERLFASAQEAIRKDVERAFGVLVARFHILARPSRLWYRRDIDNVMKACVIIHNMVVEARRDTYASGMAALGLFRDASELFQTTNTFKWQSRVSLESALGTPMSDSMWASKVMEREERITSTVDHFALKRDLIARVWKEHRI